MKLVISSFFRTNFIIFAIVNIGLTDSNDCTDPSTEMISVGGSISFEVHVRDISNYGITITYNYSVMFVDINVPGTSHFPSQISKNRTQIVIDQEHSVVKIQINGFKRFDGGTYVIKGRHLQNHTHCRNIYVLDDPLVRVKTIPRYPRWVEAGSNLVLECTARSTTYPPNHNLTMHYTWLINGTENIITDKLYVLHNVTQLDNGTIIVCQAREGKDGKSTRSYFVVTVHWGPKNIKFYPPKDFYKVYPGTTIPTVNGTADCNPPCSFKWTKDKKEISATGILTIGTVNQTTEGVYTLNALRKETSDSQTKSLTVALKVFLESDNKTSYIVPLWSTVVGIVCVVIVVALVWSGKGKKLIDRLNCHRGTGEATELNQTDAKLINNDGPSSCTPSKDNMQNEKFEKAVPMIPRLYVKIYFNKWMPAQSYSQVMKLNEGPCEPDMTVLHTVLNRCYFSANKRKNDRQNTAPR